MGFQWRKRTKGKNAWLNFSASKSRGAGMSFSMKFGNTTVNAGTGGRRRVTVNLGNGLRYVKTRTVKKKVKTESNYNYTKRKSGRKSYAPEETYYYIPIESISITCRNTGDLLEKFCNELDNEDDKIILGAIREALVVHVQKGIDENDRDTLNLLQECIDEVIKLKNKATDEDYVTIYGELEKILTAIKNGFSIGVYEKPKNLEDANITWTFVIIGAIICFAMLMIIR